MSRYRNILEGAGIEEIRENEGGFDYYGFLRSDSTWVIMRRTIATSSFKYAVGSKNFTTNFSNRAGLTYFPQDKFKNI